jgi:2-amino-4-hydroxy-6-hydroxymethyldihydropteridine diphosphokinase
MSALLLCATAVGMVEVLIGLGANVGDVRNTLGGAIALLCQERDVVLRARSSDYRTPPWGVEAQPAFINCAIAVETDLTPHRLLSRTQGLEQMLGRERVKGQHWGPRPIDIDLLAYGDLTLQSPDLTLPHPRLFARAFVLVPLAEIVPDRLVAGIRVGDALARVDASGIERLTSAEQSR